jgi:uncharacterized membrane protein YsdA (DUF1294 family)
MNRIELIRWALSIYVTLSVITFAAYAIDKSAAAQRGARVPEKTLLLLGLLGGWPGGLLAQQWLRHKTRKQPFRILFWLSVLLHGGALIATVAIWRSH